MNDSDLRTKVLQEIQQIPEGRLVELYDLVHTFRLNAKSRQSASTLQFAGCWNELDDAVYSDFLDDVMLRRQQAFSERPDRETSID
ncbi:MAG: hypothetical protein B0A82_02290 [Alkalinema sp. CACIAM 70d]|nr:MAG: hypothetical protein B0A82_02290 [Alkalinema sp. CACIAM 70d]